MPNDEYRDNGGSEMDLDTDHTVGSFSIVPITDNEKYVHSGVFTSQSH